MSVRGLKQWIVQFERAFLDLLGQHSEDGTCDQPRLYAEPCPVHEGCARVVLADVVVSHSLWAETDPAAVAETVLAKVLSVPH